MLIEDLLRALGKHPHALARERCTRDGLRLLAVWLRAEQVHHLVVLRAHLLSPAVLAALVDLAPAGCMVWLVWHHHDPPPHPSIDWVRALAALSADEAHRQRSPRGDPYPETVTAARAEARAWRPEPHRLGWQVRTGSTPGPGAIAARCSSGSPSTPPTPLSCRSGSAPPGTGSPPKGRL